MITLPGASPSNWALGRIQGTSHSSIASDPGVDGVGDHEIAASDAASDSDCTVGV
jgi:hypothetical protein